MIARHDAPTLTDKPNLWSALAAPLDAATITWRQEGNPVLRDREWYARYVAHPGANAVRERLDRVVPGEWDLTLELLPTLPARGDAVPECAFKARLQILGVIREDVGTGPDYKAAANDALARAAVRFGIGHELTDREPNWVLVENVADPAQALAASAGPVPYPVESPDASDRRRSATAEQRRRATHQPIISARGAGESSEPLDGSDMVPATAPAPQDDEPNCPKCSGRMWDNRLTKRNPKAPDYKCRDRSCDGVIWPTRPGESANPASTSSAAASTSPGAASTSSAARGGGGGGENARGRSTDTGAEPATATFDPAPLGSAFEDDDLPF